MKRDTVVRWTTLEGVRRCSDVLTEDDARSLAHKLESRYHFSDIKVVNVC